ncbi:MAG: hypothetical protein ABJP70_05525 [Erythrobacter sp.]
MSTPVQIRSTGDGSTARAGVTISLPEEDTLSDRGRLATALEQAFANRSVANQPQAELIADYALSTNAAGSGIATNSEETPSQEPNWIILPRDKKRFDRCGAKRMLATLILFNRTSGAMVYRGQTAKIECDFEDADIAEMADNLVEDALKAHTN